MTDKKPIIITVEGGLVQGISNIPEGVTVEVHDYDTADGHDPQVDQDGSIYNKSQWIGATHD